jgi:hypothetical protein
MLAAKTRLRNELLNLFGSRFFLIFLILGTLIRIFIGVGLGGCSAFAPDEGAYLQLYKHIYEGKVAPEIFFTHANSFFLAIYYLPTFLIHKLGISLILAIRFSSVAFFVITSILVWGLLIRNPAAMYFEEKKSKWHKLAFLFLGIPTVTIWASLGLRDILIGLELCLISWALIFFRRKNYIPSGVIMSIALSGLINTRPYVYVLSVLALISWFVVEREKKVVPKKILIIALALVLSMGSSPGTARSVHIPSVNWSKFTYSLSFNSMFSHTFPANSISLTALRNCLKKNSLGVFSSVGKLVSSSSSSSSSTSNVSATDLNVQDTIGEIRNPLSLPIGLFYFLLSPIPGMNNGSLIANVAGLEIVFWLVLYLAFSIGLWRRRSFGVRLDSVSIFAITWVILFVVFSSLTEINVGTMVRHRAMLVIPMCLVIATTYRREPKSIPVS